MEGKRMQVHMIPTDGKKKMVREAKNNPGIAI